MIQQAGIAFFGMAALDIIFARYTLAVTSRRPVWASGYASVCLLLGGSVVVTYAHDPIMLLPAAAGAFVGTYIGMWRR